MNRRRKTRYKSQPFTGISRRAIAVFVLVLVITLFQFIGDSGIGHLLLRPAVLVPDATYVSKTTYTCAPWIEKKERKVLFIELATMERYYRQKDIYRGGEFYMSASLDYALRQNGFSVERLEVNSIQRKGGLAKIAHKYHRIFANGVDRLKELDVSTLEWPAMCKFRSEHWWGNAEEPMTKSDIPFDPKQWLKPFPTADFYNTFLGFFPHSVLLRKEYPDPERRKVGMLFGKFPVSFRRSGPIIEALLQDGFELHSTCWDCKFPSQVIRHENVGPGAFVDLLKTCAFVLGFGHPYDSPTPIEGLANGAAFLNPIAVGALPINETVFSLGKGPGLRATQHVPLSMLGMPYVYNVHLNNVTQVVLAANHAVRFRFSSFVPPDYHPLAVIARTCGILEDDSLCQCPNPIGGGDYRLYKERDVNVECRGSSTLRKSTTEDDANFMRNISFYRR